MSFIKNIDYFQKISFDIQKSTFIGAIISICSISIIVTLIFREFIDYLTPSIKKDAIINHSHDHNSMVNFHFGLHLNGSPCSMSSVIYQEDFGINHIDVDNKIQFTRFDIFQKVINEPYDSSFPSCTKSLSDGEGCGIAGYIEMSKTPGFIIISPKKQRQQYFMIKAINSNLSKNFSLKHKFFYIMFGDNKIHESVYKRFGYENMEDFNRKDLPDYKMSDMVYFDYFIKIIPHILYDESRGTKTLTYQYSINHNERPLAHGTDVPMITLKFDLSDITIQVTLENKSFLHFMTHICAIVGGIYMIFSILNRILINLLDFGFSDDKKKIISQ